MEITGNEPVIPVIPFNKDDINLVEDGLYAGIRLRQLFAMEAMKSLSRGYPELGRSHSSEIATQAVEIADALIEALNQDRP